MNKSTGSIPVTDLSLTDIANIFHAVGNLLTSMQEELLEEQRMKDEQERMERMANRQFAYAALLAEQEERILL